MEVGMYECKTLYHIISLSFEKLIYVILSCTILSHPYNTMYPKMLDCLILIFICEVS